MATHPQVYFVRGLTYLTIIAPSQIVDSTNKLRPACCPLP